MNTQQELDSQIATCRRSLKKITIEREELKLQTEKTIRERKAFRKTFLFLLAKRFYIFGIIILTLSLIILVK